MNHGLPKIQQKRVIELKFPSLLSNSQVASKLGITRQNMPHQRKSKGFPLPVLTVDKFPMWLESDIDAWMESKNKKVKDT